MRHFRSRAAAGPIGSYLSNVRYAVIELFAPKKINAALASASPRRSRNSWRADDEVSSAACTWTNRRGPVRPKPGGANQEWTRQLMTTVEARFMT
jgi:hypothetical protein